MNNKLNIIIAFLLFTFLCGACKNKAVDYYRFGISDELVHPESDRVVISGTYSFEGEVNAMKLNLGLDDKLNDAVSYPVNLEGCDFSVRIDSLKPNTLYYYCYSVSFGMRNDYLTEIDSFSTLQGVPLVETIETIAMSEFSCQVKCKAVSDCGASITERGVYWNTTGEPGINDHKLKHAESGLGEYVCQMDSLEPNTTYFIRAYAENVVGNGFGNVVEFRTGNSPELPTVITAEISEITATSAKCGGEVLSDGGSPVIRRGVCWSTEHNPTIDDNPTDNGSGLGGFDSSLSNLTPNTTYYVRAYATNSIGTGYGAEVSFIAMDGLPEVLTLEVTDLGETTAVGHGKVTDEGASEVYERGICWGVNHNPDLSDNHEQSGTGLGEFEVTMIDLSPNKTYFVRAYATNTQGTVFGNEESFMIEKVIDKPIVTIDSIGNVSPTRATVYGNLISDGGDEVTELGICWGTSANPTTNPTSVTVVMGAFPVPLNDLQSGTTYHVRAYAVNTAGTAYSADFTFTTTVSLFNPPTVTTHPEVTNITQTSAFCGGTVTNSGGMEVRERGLCWSTHPNPTIDDYSTQIGSGLGDFSGMFNGLTMGTTYYLKAYAKNDVGLGYGEERTFTTSGRPDGALGHFFSVGYDKQVWFSRGNLQFRAVPRAWQFAENQYEIIGQQNSSMSDTCSCWIDLFGWGTSGYDHGAICYQPWSTNATNSNYYYAYGNAIYHLFEETGQADWGYNAISNGGNEEHKWRTLKYNEWDYLLNQRQTKSGVRYAKATVNDVCGLVILPDDWDESVHSFSSSSSYGANIFDSAQWRAIEDAGAVFLPAGGTRNGRITDNIGSIGYYWSASNKDGSVNAYYLYFTNSEIQPKKDRKRLFGGNVRLVYDKP